MDLTSTNSDVVGQVRHSPARSCSDTSMVPPCQVACPLHMDIREYVDLTAQGKIMEALNVIRRDNPFPSICARVCTHPCEDACRRTQVDKPISIRAIKRFAVEFGGDRMFHVESETTQAEKVAIVGSGAAGLACAYYLRKMGYPVTVFEAHSELGGMLRVGIPQYRLPRDVVETEVQRLIQMGVEIRAGTRVVSLDLLFDMGYRAIFLTIGAHQGLKLQIEGEDGPGVVDGATLLREVNLGLKPSLGDKVAVVGGGNVAIDAARTAIRLGSHQVKVLYRRSRTEMPANEEEVTQALEEGVIIDFLVAPTRIRRHNGRLKVVCIRMELGEPDSKGRRQPVPIAGSEFEEDVDTIITAIGQAPQSPGVFGVRLSKGSTIQIDPVTLTTNRSGVFAGGDAVTGPATVVEALAAGRKAARRIDDYLRHRYPLDTADPRPALSGELKPETVEMIKKIGRYDQPTLTAESRATDFRPIELVYDWETAVNEARRCLRCGMGAEIISDSKCATCLTCLRVCPYHVPNVDPTGTVHIPPEQCQACGVCVAECPATAIVLRKPVDRRHVDEELDHLATVVEQPKVRPLVIGFCCQYGLFGTGTLAGLWRGASASISIIPVLCVAKLEVSQLMRAFEIGAEGVFIAGCGDQCARENTDLWVMQRVEKVRRTLKQVNLEPDRLQLFKCNHGADPEQQLAEFIDRISTLYLTSLVMQEVRK